VVEAFAALEEAKDLPATPLVLASTSPLSAGVVPFEERLKASAGLASQASREHAMQEEITQWRARAVAQAQTATLTRGDDGNYNTGDQDLDLLLGLTDDMVQGNANMDTGLLWMSTLERLQTKLGVPAVPATPAPAVA
jgi:hypothetical protein